MIHRVTLYGTKVLRERCGSCSSLYEYYEKLAQDMFDTMLSHDGVGLAANQIGIGLRLMMFENERGYTCVRNPIVEVEGPIEYDDEGCLSLPTLRMPVARHKFARIRGTTPGGDPIPELLLRDYPARVVQHELDHLNGLSILEATGAVSRNVNRKRWAKRYPRIREWWDTRYKEDIERANEQIRSKREEQTPRIVLPGDKGFSTHDPGRRVADRIPPGQRQRQDAHSTRTSNRPLVTNPDGSYT